MNCPKCNAANSENAKFCKACGLDLKSVANAEVPLETRSVKCLKCGTENGLAAKFCKACGMVTVPAAATSPAPLPVPIAVPIPPPVPPPLPASLPLPAQLPTPVLTPHLIPRPAPHPLPPPLTKPAPPPVPATPAPLPSQTLMPAPLPLLAPQSVLPFEIPADQQTGMACFKCSTLNNVSAKFCKSCGVPSPSQGATMPLSKEDLPGRDVNSFVLRGCATAAVIVLVGGGAYYMFAGSGKAKVPESQSTTNPVAQPAKTVPLTPPVAATPVPTPPVAVAATPVAPSAEVPVPALLGTADPAAAAVTKPSTADPVKASAPAGMETKTDAPVLVVPSLAPALSDETRRALAGAEREASRKKQAERDAKARQLARDKATLDRTNRTLDDLLRN